MAINASSVIFSVSILMLIGTFTDIRDCLKVYHPGCVGKKKSSIYSGKRWTCSKKLTLTEDDSLVFLWTSHLFNIPKCS